MGRIEGARGVRCVGYWRGGCLYSVVEGGVGWLHLAWNLGRRWNFHGGNGEVDTCKTFAKYEEERFLHVHVVVLLC